MRFREVDVKTDSPKYWRVATKEEMKYMTKELLAKIRKAALYVYIDPDTFTPFLVVDGVRYDIEFIIDRNLS